MEDLDTWNSLNNIKISLIYTTAYSEGEGDWSKLRESLRKLRKYRIWSFFIKFLVGELKYHVK